MTEDPRSFEDDEFLDDDYTVAITKVKAPAIGMIVSGSLTIVSGLWGIASSLLGLQAAQLEDMEQQSGGSMDWLNTYMEIATNPLLQLPALILGGLVIYGAYQMLKLQSRNWAMTAGIISVVPCFQPCCLVGLIFGIWSLVVLNDGAVSRAFEARPPSASTFD